MAHGSALLVGALLAAGVGLLARLSGMDRDRAFYPTVTIVVGCLYILFAAIGASTTVLAQEAIVAVVFVALAVASFRWSLWIAAAALGAHGLLDLVHARIIANPGVPDWWPAFCGAYDVVAAVGLGGLLATGRVRARA